MECRGAEHGGSRSAGDGRRGEHDCGVSDEQARPLSGLDRTKQLSIGSSDHQPIFAEAKLLSSVGSASAITNANGGARVMVTANGTVGADRGAGGTGQFLFGFVGWRRAVWSSRLRPLAGQPILAAAGFLDA